MPRATRLNTSFELSISDKCGFQIELRSKRALCDFGAMGRVEGLSRILVVARNAASHAGGLDVSVVSICSGNDLSIQRLRLRRFHVVKIEFFGQPPRAILAIRPMRDSRLIGSRFNTRRFGTKTASWIPSALTIWKLTRYKPAKITVKANVFIVSRCRILTIERTNLRLTS